MQADNRPEVYAGHGTHGSPAYGYGKIGSGMGAAQDLAPGERNPAGDAEGGEKMTGAEVDAIKEAADAMAWEELNEDDPHAKAAVDLLTKAAHALQQAEDFLQQAAAEVEDSPETYRIASLEGAVEELETLVRSQARRF
jgi:hypothetical protein